MRLRNPDRLEMAMSYVVEEENFCLTQKQSNIVQHLSNLNNQQNSHWPANISRLL